MKIKKNDAYTEVNLLVVAECTFEELLVKMEPYISQLSSSTKNNEDTAQLLRVSLWKAYNAYDYHKGSAMAYYSTCLKRCLYNVYRHDNTCKRKMIMYFHDTAMVDYDDLHIFEEHADNTEILSDIGFDECSMYSNYENTASFYLNIDIKLMDNMEEK